MQEYPTYGYLIGLLEEVGAVTASETRSVADILSEKFVACYPHIPISRPSRFLDTVRRLAAPTKPSTLGEQKLMDTPLASYFRRRWMPRNRRQRGILISYCVYHE